MTSPKALLDRLGYTDTLLLAMLLDPGEMSEPWDVDKYSGLREGHVDGQRINFGRLKPGPFGFPRVTGAYVHVSDVTDPIRVETFTDLGADQLTGSACRAFRYARLLPGYGFPVGLDIVDKYAHVPDWMTNAYGKLIRMHLADSLVRGEISDQQMRRIIVEAIYMTHRDWLFRPQVQ